MVSKIYISGKIGGEPMDDVRRKFAAAGTKLRALGMETVNPLDNGLPEDAPWEKHMAKDMAMLAGCDAIYMLPDWTDSRGAGMEHDFAVHMGMTVIYGLKGFLDGKGPEIGAFRQ